MDDCLAGFNNARDLGGLPLRGGGTIAPGAIIRSETPLDYSPRGDAAPLPDFARVIDLRSVEEAATRRHPMADYAAYRLRPLIDPSAEAQRDPASEVTLGAVYKGSLRRNASMIAAIMTEISDAPDGTVLISCTSGKDRTGMVVAILLRLAGVPNESIGLDYARTEQSMREVFAEELNEAPDSTTAEAQAYFQNANAENITEMLAHVGKTYGTVEQYLLGIGLNQDQIDRLNARMRRPVRPSFTHNNEALR